MLHKGIFNEWDVEQEGGEKYHSDDREWEHETAMCVICNVSTSNQ